jgi:hypothetical protein
MAMPNICDLQALILCQDEKTKHVLRVIEFKDKEGCLVRKIGLSIFFYSKKYNKWYPSRNHVFLPLCGWHRLLKVASEIESCLQPAEDNVRNSDGHPGGVHEPGDTASRQSSVSAKVTAASTDCGKRQRGRPPKRANAVAASDKQSGADPAETAEAERIAKTSKTTDCNKEEEEFEGDRDTAGSVATACNDSDIV